MEQIKTLDIVKERVKFVRESTQHAVALRPISIDFLENGFVVRYVIQQNRIIHLVFDCREMPTEDKIKEMQPYLSIDNLDNVHVVTPNDDKNSIQVWLWKDIAYKILTKDADKEVLNHGKSKENNVQDKPRRNKIINFGTKSTKDICACCGNLQNGHCAHEDSVNVTGCKFFIEKKKNDVHVESGEVGCTLECYHRSFSKCSLKDVSFDNKTGNCLDYVPAKKFDSLFECHNSCVHKSDDDHCTIEPSFNKFKECLFYEK